MTLQKIKKSRKHLIGVSIALSLALAFIVYCSHRGLYQVYLLKQEQLRLDQENARLAEENARLARTIDRLQHDPEMIQDLIRKELNFVKPNEIILQLSPGDGSSPPVLSPARNYPAPSRRVKEEKRNRGVKVNHAGGPSKGML
ncbi:MAG: septum formation initiator family protein [Thermodesulfobacteriota bacterium]